MAAIDQPAQSAPMLTKVEQILQDALALSADDREAVLAALQDSLEPADSEPLTKEWGDELRRRMDEYRSGRGETYSFEEVMSELRASLHQR